MTVLFEAVHAGAFIVSEEPEFGSRDEIYIEASQTIAAGQVLGRTAVAATARSSAAASAGNTGNGTIAMDATAPVADTAQDGTYSVVCLATTASGTFEVFDPHGLPLGRVVAGATFSDQIKFVITAGGTAFAVGDAFQVAVGIEAETAAASEQLGMVGGGSITMDATAPINFATALPGTYTSVCTATAVGGGTFTIYDPAGNDLGTVAVGATFNDEIKFVIAASGTDFALGDTFLINVELGEVERYQYCALNLTATDGTEDAAAVAVYPITTTTTPAPISAIVRGVAQVRFADLTWPAGMTVAQMAVAIEQLRQRGIICR